MGDGELWEALAREAAATRDGIRQLKVVEPVTPEEVRRDLERRFSFDHGRPLAELVPEVGALLRRWTVHVTHPRYFGLFNPSVRAAAVAGDALAAVVNPQLAAWSHAPAASELERLTLRRLAAALGLELEGLASHFTSGGAEANLSGVLSALARLHPEAATAGLAALPRRPALYVSAEAHHSFVKIARMVGLGTDAVRLVPVTARLAMDPAALDRRIREDRGSGFEPLFVAATAGTTGAGAVDPLEEIAAVAEEHGAWYHVDAAWGGAAALSPRLRTLLAGIERARSVTWDAHKWLSVPMGAGMFFCRDAEAVARAFSIATTYMPARAGEEAADPYATSAQWSRRAIGLKVFLALAELGIDGYRTLVEKQTRMGDLLRERLLAAGWELANDTPLPVVCFTHRDVRSGRTSTGEILRALYARGRVWISEVVLGGRDRVLRACITSYLTEEEDLDALVDEVERARGAAAGHGSS